MNTAEIFVDVFRLRTEGRKACFKINALTLDAVKVVLAKELVKLGTPGAEEDVNNGYLKKYCGTVRCYGGRDGYLPTAKGYRAILSKLN